MDAVLRAEWLKALRSGEYEQGRFMLRTSTNQFCCLGVLCDVANKIGKVVGSWGQDNHSQTHFNGISQYAPEQLLDIDTQRELGKANDDGLDFEQIAGIIEERVPVNA